MRENSLNEYQEKRDFDKANEPHGYSQTKKYQGRFVIQKHDISDEWKGRLKYRMVK